MMTTSSTDWKCIVGEWVPTYGKCSDKNNVMIEMMKKIFENEEKFNEVKEEMKIIIVQSMHYKDKKNISDGINLKYKRGLTTDDINKRDRRKRALKKRDGLYSIIYGGLYPSNLLERLGISKEDIEIEDKSFEKILLDEMIKYDASIENFIRDIIFDAVDETFKSIDRAIVKSCMKNINREKCWVLFKSKQALIDRIDDIEKLAVVPKGRAGVTKELKELGCKIIALP